MLMLPYLDCLLCARHWASSSLKLPHIGFCSLGSWLSILNHQTQKVLLPHSDAISLKARLMEINLPCRNHILLDIKQ